MLYEKRNTRPLFQTSHIQLMLLPGGSRPSCCDAESTAAQILTLPILWLPAYSPLSILQCLSPGSCWSLPLSGCDALNDDLLQAAVSHGVVEILHFSPPYFRSIVELTVLICSTTQLLVVLAYKYCIYLILASSHSTSV